MPAEKLQFDSRAGEWRGKPPPSRLQEWANREDDWHSGFIVGLVTNGFLSVFVAALVFVLSTLG